MRAFVLVGALVSVAVLAQDDATSQPQSQPQAQTAQAAAPVAAPQQQPSQQQQQLEQQQQAMPEVREPAAPEDQGVGGAGDEGQGVTIGTPQTVGGAPEIGGSPPIGGAGSQATSNATATPAPTSETTATGGAGTAGAQPTTGAEAERGGGGGAMQVITPAEEAEGKNADVRPLTPAEVAQMQQQLEEQARALEASQQQIQQLQSQVSEHRQELNTTTQRSINTGIAVKEQHNSERIGALQNALQAFAVLQEALLAGNRDVGETIVAAGQALARADQVTGMWGSPAESQHLILARAELQRVAPFLQDRDVEQAMLSSSRAALHVQNALTLATGAATTGR